MTSQKTCTECGGRGLVDCDACDDQHMEPCDECDGEGLTPCNECDGGGDCPACLGAKVRCATCDGAGRVACHLCDGTDEVECSRCENTGEEPEVCEDCGEDDCDGGCLPPEDESQPTGAEPASGGGA